MGDKSKANTVMFFISISSISCVHAIAIVIAVVCALPAVLVFRTVVVVLLQRIVRVSLINVAILIACN